MTKEKGKIYLQCELLSDVFDRGMQPKREYHRHVQIVQFTMKRSTTNSFQTF